MSLPPLAILALGIAIVLGMILVLRVNAFLALLTAAITVSLLAPGATEDKIPRVANAFGGAVASIGIVIALAAVIGQCMMDSGAADRVVRAFLRLLGVKRSPWALLGSGYILAIPVFFDTVFYLLVPLARSFYRRTGGSYLKCLLAIAAGGAVTHTLVPPTPGPLTIAANLNIDLGVMIGIGALVAFPAAIAGLMFGAFMDRIMPIPMRPLSDRPEPEPIPDSALPPLFLSLLPVLLPVLLIAASTALSALADAEGAARFKVGDIEDPNAFRLAIVEAPEGTPAAQIRQLLPEPEAWTRPIDQKRMVQDLNVVLGNKGFFDPAVFEDVLLADWKIARRIKATEDPAEQNRLESVRLAGQLALADVNKLSTAHLERRNRALIDASLPNDVGPHAWNTPLREWANTAALLGNPNFALLLSAAIAIGLYVHKRRPTSDEVTRQIESALMSGGVIILITAAGVAFGKMLEAAQVGPAIEALFKSESGETNPYLWLVIGFSLAAVLKIAQGSSTAAMIIGSSMLATTVSSGSLPFHVVYLATAIASGSLIGSWMNDSGFWVFTKMGGLTEAEGLKTWTPLLIVLGGTGFAMTLLLATVLPLK